MALVDRNRAVRLAGIVLVLWLILASLLVLIPAPAAFDGPPQASRTPGS